MRISFSSGCVLKGNILYNYNTGVRVYLGDKGLKLIRKINEGEGKIKLSNKYEKFFIKELKKVRLIVESNDFIPIEEELDNTPPHIIIWEPTTKCNFDCKYCYVKWFGGDRELDQDVLNKALQEIVNSPALEVIITGGEPLILGDKLKEIIKKLRKAKKGIVLFTNGSLLTKEWLEFFKENNVRLHISLDTLLPGKDVRNSNLLYKILRNIILARKVGIKVVIQSTLHPKNIEYFNQIRYFAKILGSEMRYDIETPVCSEMIFEFYSVLPKFKELLESLNIVPKKDHEGCGAGVYSIFIRSDGSVTPCTMFYNVVAGNIMERDLKDILNNPQSTLFKEIQKLCSSRFPTNYLDFCKRCPIRFMCNSGCRARSYLINRNIYGVDPKRCYVEKEILIKKAIEDGYVITLLSLLTDYYEVSKEFYEKALSRLLIEWERVIKENYIWYVTFENRIEGIVIFNKKDENTGTILWIVVSPNARNKGIGSFLLKKAEESLKELGCKKVRLSTNKVALEFYLKNRYKVVDSETIYKEKIFIVEKDI